MHGAYEARQCLTERSEVRLDTLCVSVVSKSDGLANDGARANVVSDARRWRANPEDLRASARVSEANERRC